MHQKISGVYKVIRRRLNGILSDVTATRLDVLCSDIAEKPHIEVSSNDLPGSTHTFRKPARNGPTASAHFEAPPAFGDTNRVELTKRRRIVVLLNQLQAGEFVARFVVAPE